MLGNNSSIWTEKYRPLDFESFKGQDHIVGKIKSFVETKNMPHLLFSGPAGVGKTTLSLIIARKFFGDNWQSSFLELNASDERGIDVIRNNVKDFAKTKALSNIPFKIIYLDECDALTKEAQQALRRTMENYTKTTRFILSCNYSSKMIDPIQSRCAIFRFRRLTEEQMAGLMDSIIVKEKLKVSPGAKKALSIVSEGDCRRLENLMQSCAALSENIDEKLVYSLGSIARPEEIKNMLNFALKGKFVESRRLLFTTMYEYGLSGTDIIKQIQQAVLSLEIADKLKMKLIEKCGQTEFRLVEGSDEYVQLEALLAFVVLAGSI